MWNLLLHILASYWIISSLPKSVNMIWSLVVHLLTYGRWRDEHLWTMTSSWFYVILLLISLGMRIFGHIEVFIDQIIVNNLMTVNMMALILWYWILSNSQTWNRCSFLRFKLYLRLLDSYILRTIDNICACMSNSL